MKAEDFEGNLIKAIVKAGSSGDEPIDLSTDKSCVSYTGVDAWTPEESLMWQASMWAMHESSTDVRL